MMPVVIWSLKKVLETLEGTLMTSLEITPKMTPPELTLLEIASPETAAESGGARAAPRSRG
jgi:hypothetical protein